MRVTAVAQAKVDRCEFQRRRVARLIRPAYLGIADQDLALAQHPIGHAPVPVPAIDAHACDVERAVGCAAHLELGAVDRKRVQAQVAENQGAPRDHILDRGQDERLASLLVVDPHIRERELRPESEPTRLDASDLYRQADCAGKPGHDLAAIALDVRQQPVADAQHDACDGEECDPEEDFQNPPGGAQGTRTPLEFRYPRFAPPVFLCVFRLHPLCPTPPARAGSIAWNRPGRWTRRHVAPVCGTCDPA